MKMHIPQKKILERGRCVTDVRQKSRVRLGLDGAILPNEVVNKYGQRAFMCTRAL